MILCDTNILIEVYRGNENVVDKLKGIGQENLAISDVTAAELLFGARNKNELKIIKSDINKLIEIPINEEISRMAVHLVEKYSLSHNLSLPDALIASTSIIYDVKLYTLNMKDFKFLKNVKFVD
jgi:tRNA(fMet)-specific endonuclease VapC